jgi:preprotein translocase subunit SecD
MKRAMIFFSVLMLFSCNVQLKKPKQQPKLSIKECFEKNLTDSTLMTGWYYVVNTNDGFYRQLDQSDEIYVLNPCPIVTFEDIIKLKIEEDEYANYLAMWFGERGTEEWAKATEISINKELAFILEDKLISTPHVHSTITNGVSVIGRKEYLKADLENIKQTIENNIKQVTNVENNTQY